MLTIKQEIEALKELYTKLSLKVNTNSLYILDNTSHLINDEGGFYIQNNQINYIDTAGQVSATYDLFDSEDNPTDTYIVKKVLVSKIDEQLQMQLDRAGGSTIVTNQQIYYDINGDESCRYNLFDANGEPTMSEIFEKRLVV